MAKALVKRRTKRGRPRIDEKTKKCVTIPVYVARDPQGIKVFKKKPVLSITGIWDGDRVPGVDAMDSRTFVMKFRNAVLPARGQVLSARMAV